MKRILIVMILIVAVAGIGFASSKFIHRASSATTQPAKQTATKQTDAKTQQQQAVSVSNLSMTDINGKPVKIDPNKLTVLHFMVTSCSTCLPTEETLTKFQNQNNVQLISIDVDPQNDNADSIQTFKKATGATWPYVMDTNQSLIQQFHITELDTVIVLHHGQVIYKGVAPSSADLKKVLA
ncbi:TlpA family protein disulfide reductase [Fodinisporobacter ferrooxydans]|uniref:TlpA family protein disulfide reductase n=1 Tax=Fodinisporobacter ferrooxydans TaxID=2901836 RepID=A0ABY4CK48_9BACL|nr:TlpA family protein disulfide reductase [Alicyclobacillaceae bacterium MYW30-H2]